MLSFLFLFLLLSISSSAQSISGNAANNDYITSKISYNLSGSSGCRCYNVFYRADLRQSNSYVQTISTADNRKAISNTGEFNARVLGPNATQTFGLRVWYSGKNYFSGFPAGCYPTNSDCGSNTLKNDLLTISTVPIKPPVNLSATQDKLAGVQLSWTGTTNIPSDQHGYKIYRKIGEEEQLIASLGGSTRTYFDSIGPDQNPTYFITTFTNSWGGHESVRAEIVGNTYTVNFQATKGAGADTRLSWNGLPIADNNLEHAKEVILFRDGEEIRLVAGSIRSFTDLNGIPGLPHQYGLEIIQNNGTRLSYLDFPSLSNEGYRTPNGVIEGFIYSPGSTEERAPIPGVEVCAEAISEISASPYSGKRCAITEADGSYRIDSFFYDRYAEIRVMPVDTNRKFDPAFLTEELWFDSPQRSDRKSLAQAVNFIDTTSISVSGFVQQFFGEASCPVEGVKITAVSSNGLQQFETISDGTGYYALALNSPGEYTITPSFFEHAFSPASFTNNIIEDTENLNFENVQTQILSGKVLGGCESFLGWARLRIFEGENSNTTCMDTLIMTDASSGDYAIELPARTYTVEIQDFFPSVDLDPVNFTSLEPQTTDLREQDQEVNFTYRLPLSVSIEFPESSFICDPQDYAYPVLGQYTIVPVQIKVEEAQQFTSMDISCPLDTGTLVIKDQISDSVKTFNFSNGLLVYEMFPGAPNLAASEDYLKLIDVEAKDIAGERVASVMAKALVVGNRPREETFVTVTPEVPYLILRDPPGDRSFSFYSETSSISRAFSIYARAQDVRRFNLGRKIVKNGFKSILPSPNNSAGGGLSGIASNVIDGVKNLFTVSENNWDHKENIITFSNYQSFSTSNDPSLIGSEGDVYIGSAFNLAYSLTDILEFDETNCKVSIDTSLIFAIDSIPTQFIYTEKFIKNSLIPDLQRIKKNYAVRYFQDTTNQAIGDSLAYYHNQIVVWETTIARNEQLKKATPYDTNISISSGGTEESSVTTDSISSFNLDFSVNLVSAVSRRLQLSNKIGVPVAGVGPEQSTVLAVDNQLRIQTRLGFSQRLSFRIEEKVGYKLEDDDTDGDFMSVGIGKDLEYGTPVFKLFNGRTSCPWEPGTQPRDFAQLSADQFNPRATCQRRFCRI